MPSRPMTEAAAPAAPAGGSARSVLGRPSPIAIWAGIWVLYLVWGSTYLGISVAVETIPPFLMAGVRFVLAGGILLAWTVVREGRAFGLPSLRELRDSTIVAALLLGGGMGLVAFGEQSVPSGIAALLIAMMPLWVAVFGRIGFGERLSPLAVVGIALGLGGVAILVSPGDASLGGVDALHLGALIVSPMSWAAGSLFAAHRAVLPRRPLIATGFQMLLGGVVLLAMSGAAGEPAGFDPAAISGRSVLAVAYLAFVGSILAFTTYGWLLRVAPLPKVATYAYVNPIVAVILGWLVLSEPITARTIVAGGVIVAAVALIITARSRLAARAEPHEDRPALEALPGERRSPGHGPAASGRAETPRATRRPAEVLVTVEAGPALDAHPEP